MKFLLIILFSLILVNVQCQIGIQEFVALFGKDIQIIDEVLSKKYKAVLDEIDEKNGSFTWKKGFNNTHTLNNETIGYVKQDSVEQFIYLFPSDKQSGATTYDVFFENELSKTVYQKLDNTIENYGEYRALVSNYKYQNYLIKRFKIASGNGRLIKIIKQ